MVKNVFQKMKTYGNKCYYCNESLNRNNFTLDHVIPLSKKGKDNRENLRAACRPCNAKKNDLTLEEFRPLFFLMTGYRNFQFELPLAVQFWVPEHLRDIEMKEVEDGSSSNKHNV